MKNHTFISDNTFSRYSEKCIVCGIFKDLDWMYRRAGNRTEGTNIGNAFGSISNDCDVELIISVLGE